ncbi:MAG: RsmE family RNA methyltransferase [Candidatus Latescibacterota bacterium]|jgi:16S rRNA (uracil1498-N3)-methyltransferase
MSSHRFVFYDADAVVGSTTVTLSGDEHHHLSRALRCSAGDTVFVTNGRGLMLECRVGDVSRHSTSAEVVSVVENDPPGRELVLALGMIKKDRFERAFEQCVELGITRCVPFESCKVSVATYTSKFLVRLHKIGIAATKQSFRSYLPQVVEPVTFERVVSAARGMDRSVVGHWKGPLPRPGGNGSTLVVVGPEGGFTDAELQSLRDAGAETAGVSPHRLRSETAAVALVGAMWRGN